MSGKARVSWHAISYYCAVVNMRQSRIMPAERHHYVMLPCTKRACDISRRGTVLVLWCTSTLSSYATPVAFIQHLVALTQHHILSCRIYTTYHNTGRGAAGPPHIRLLQFYYNCYRLVTVLCRIVMSLRYDSILYCVNRHKVM